MIRDRLYKRAFTQPYRRFLFSMEGRYVLKIIHERCCDDHVGFRAIIRKALRAGYFWPTMSRDAKEWVKKCEKCQKHGPLIHLPAKEIGVMFSPCPFAKWGIDLVVPFPMAIGQRKFLVVVVDYFSKWVEAMSLAKIDEGNIINFLWKYICCRFGIPRILVSDNGTQFMGVSICAWCNNMKIT